MRATILAVFALAIAAAAFAAEAPLPPGQERYIVVLHRNMTGQGKDVGDETTRAGGRLEAESWQESLAVFELKELSTTT